jgi:hypothetical protein
MQVSSWSSGSGGVASVSGDGNAISITGTAVDPVVNFLGATSTTGDTIYSSGANTWAKRAIGNESDVLTVVSGIPQWQPLSGGGQSFHDNIVLYYRQSEAFLEGSTFWSIIYPSGPKERTLYVSDIARGTDNSIQIASAPTTAGTVDIQVGYMPMTGGAVGAFTSLLTGTIDYTECRLSTVASVVWNSSNIITIPANTYIVAVTYNGLTINGAGIIHFQIGMALY